MARDLYPPRNYPAPPTRRRRLLDGPRLSRTAGVFRRVLKLVPLARPGQVRTTSVNVRLIRRWRREHPALTQPGHQPDASFTVTCHATQALCGSRTATPRHMRHLRRSHNGGTVSTYRGNHVIGQKGADPQAATALRAPSRRGLRLPLATNAIAAETRWPALQAAGVHELFAVVLISYSLNVRKDEPLFCELVITAAQCPTGQVLFVGNSIANDVAGLMRTGMQACLVRPGRLRPGNRCQTARSSSGMSRSFPRSWRRDESR